MKKPARLGKQIIEDLLEGLIWSGLGTQLGMVAYRVVVWQLMGGKSKISRLMCGAVSRAHYFFIPNLFNPLHISLLTLWAAIIWVLHMVHVKIFEEFQTHLSKSRRKAHHKSSHQVVFETKWQGLLSDKKGFVDGLATPEQHQDRLSTQLKLVFSAQKMAARCRCWAQWPGRALWNDSSNESMPIWDTRSVVRTSFLLTFSLKFQG